ncbi:MAG: hypothetical protein ABEH88_04115, partial [Halobacteriales archaeon]
MERLKAEYPSFWDEETGEFTGPVTTNSIEGGNWRMKKKLSVPYRRRDRASESSIRAVRRGVA